jgi:hypothetical protein
MASPQNLRFVEVEDINARLCRPGTPEETVDEFYRFGTLLFSEIQQRGSEVDRKLTNLLGWSIATLAFLLLNRTHFGQYGSYTWVAMITASIFSLGCIAIAAYAIKTRMWRAPSEADWFQKDLWEDPTTLKRYHLISLLATHQAQAMNVKTKAECLWLIEVFLLISSGVILGLILFS